MDEAGPARAPRKMKFQPKSPPQRKQKLTTPTPCSDGTDGKEDEAAQAQKLMSIFNENLRRQVPKVEKKAPVEVAFGPRPPPTSIRKFGIPVAENSSSSGWSHIKGSNHDDGELVMSSPPITKEDGTIACPTGAVDTLPQQINKDYIEPWDYHTNYPTTLPLRRPYSGDPELVNKIEFGEDSRSLEYNENIINPAKDLGLLEECDNERMFLCQIPDKLPLQKQSASVKGKEKAESSTPVESMSTSKKGNILGQLSEGYMGKMLVYRSGAVKLKLGDMLYDVSPGSDCIFPQDMVAINTAAKQCCVVGGIGKIAVVTPDIDDLLNSVSTKGKNRPQ